MHVGLGLAGHVEVDDQGDPLHVQAPGRHVRGDQDVQGAALEALDHALALGLGDVTGDARRAESAPGQLQRHLLDIDAGAHEDDGGVGVLLARGDVLGARGQDAAEGADLVLVGDDRVGLVDRVDGRRLLGDGDLDRVLEVLARHLLDGGRHRRREQRRETVVGSGGGDGLHVLGEAHAQHLVRLVQDQHAHTGKIQRALLNEVDDAAGSAHDHLGAALEGADLRTVGAAAVHGDDHQLRRAGREVLDGGGALHGELAGGGEHQGLDGLFVRVDDRQQGQAEGRGFARAGLGDADDVAQVEQRGDRLGLNGGRCDESHVCDGLEEFVRQTEVREGDRVLFSGASVLRRAPLLFGAAVLGGARPVGPFPGRRAGVDCGRGVQRGGAVRGPDGPGPLVGSRGDCVRPPGIRRGGGRVRGGRGSAGAVDGVRSHRGVGHVCSSVLIVDCRTVSGGPASGPARPALSTTHSGRPGHHIQEAAPLRSPTLSVGPRPGPQPAGDFSHRWCAGNQGRIGALP